VAFTSHNRASRRALHGPRIVLSRNPVTLAAHVLRWGRQLVNHARVGRLRRLEPDYALLNDRGHDYACLHYYVDQGTQRRQLESHGFRVLDVLDDQGRAVPEVDPAAESPWLMYVARRERPALPPPRPARAAGPPARPRSGASSRGTASPGRDRTGPPPGTSRIPPRARRPRW